jgi:hypothetical protein
MFCIGKMIFSCYGYEYERQHKLFEWNWHGYNVDVSNRNVRFSPGNIFRKAARMRTFIKIVFILMFVFTLTMATGCAPTLVSISTPEIQTVENPLYGAQFEPLAEGKNYFDRFRLRVTNRTQKDLEIDWNKTRYIYNGRDIGVFVFEGIKPENIKNLTIPADIIPAGESFTKDITPLKLLAREPITGKGAKAGQITTGPIPTGESGIFLFIRQNGNTIKEKMAVKISEKKLQ